MNITNNFMTMLRLSLGRISGLSCHSLLYRVASLYCQDQLVVSLNPRFTSFIMLLVSYHYCWPHLKGLCLHLEMVLEFGFGMCLGESVKKNMIGSEKGGWVSMHPNFGSPLNVHIYNVIIVIYIHSTECLSKDETNTYYFFRAVDSRIV